MDTVARFKDGSLRIYTGNTPDRDEDYGGWDGSPCFDWAELDENLSQFHNLKLEDEPIEVDILPVKTKKERILQELKDKVFDCVIRYFDYGMDDHPLKERQDAAAKVRKECMDELCWRWQDYNDITYDPENTWDLNYEYNDLNKI